MAWLTDLTPGGQQNPPIHYIPTKEETTRVRNVEKYRCPGCGGVCQASFKNARSKSARQHATRDGGGSHRFFGVWVAGLRPHGSALRLPTTHAEGGNGSARGREGRRSAWLVCWLWLTWLAGLADGY